MCTVKLDCKSAEFIRLYRAASPEHQALIEDLLNFWTTSPEFQAEYERRSPMGPAELDRLVREWRDKTKEEQGERSIDR